MDREQKLDAARTRLFAELRRRLAYWLAIVAAESALPGFIGMPRPAPIPAVQGARR